LTTSGNLCGGSRVVSGSSDWLWSREIRNSPSCTSPAMENNAMMCENDITSVVLQGNGQPQCISSHMSDCRFDMHQIERLDFDLDMLGCGGTWAAPLWMTPDYWEGGGASGEIDMVENCPSTEVRSNFAGGGSQITWTIADPNSFRGHCTMWKQADANGVQSIHVKVCNPSEVVNGACPEDGAAYLHDIYGLNGCAKGNCMYTMVSDIWNGLSGDGGYTGCANGQTHYSSGCSTSITNVRFQASSGTFTGKCAALVGGSPSPSPSPSPTPGCTSAYNDPWSTGSHVPCCSGTTETLNNWDGDGRYYYKCMPSTSEMVV